MYYLEQIGLDQEMSKLREKFQQTMPDNPILAGWASFSQCDEDGIIRECLSRIAQLTPLSNTFIEIGCSDGLENNSHQLLLDGYSGFWIDGDPQKVAYLDSQLGGLQFDRLFIRNSFVSLDNIAELISQATEFLGSTEIDFFTLDVDGNDLHLMPVALHQLKPKLICVEYNAKFPPPSRLTMDYNPDHQWAGDDYFGASLQSWIDILSDYTLVCCNLSGANAFFVRNDLQAGFSIYPLAEIYQPARYWLANGSFGHKNSLKWLKQSLLVL